MREMPNDAPIRFAVVLDNVRSIHNVGSIFRTADALGAEVVYCCGITPGPLDRFKKVRADFAKVSLGAENFVAWQSVKTTTEALEDLKAKGWKIFAIEQAKNSIPYNEAVPLIISLVRNQKKAGDAVTPMIALVLGAEVDGVSPAALALADEILEIPMHGSKESLNVAVAFGIVAFGLRDGVLKSNKR